MQHVGPSAVSATHVCVVPLPFRSASGQHQYFRTSSRQGLAISRSDPVSVECPHHKFVSPSGDVAKPCTAEENVCVRWFATGFGNETEVQHFYK